MKALKIIKIFVIAINVLAIAYLAINNIWLKQELADLKTTVEENADFQSGMWDSQIQFNNAIIDFENAILGN